MRRWRSPLIVLVLAACGGQGRSSSDAGHGLGDQGAVCNWPASADTYDSATDAGCSPSRAFNICEVPNGSTVHADGGVTLPDGGSGTMDCSDACTSREFALSCYSGGLEPIRSPAAGLTCRLIPVPTPAGALFYCCTCAS